MTRSGHYGTKQLSVGKGLEGVKSWEMRLDRSPSVKCSRDSTGKGVAGNYEYENSKHLD